METLNYKQFNKLFESSIRKESLENMLFTYDNLTELLIVIDNRFIITDREKSKSLVKEEKINFPNRDLKRLNLTDFLKLFSNHIENASLENINIHHEKFLFFFVGVISDFENLGKKQQEELAQKYSKSIWDKISDFWFLPFFFNW